MRIFCIVIFLVLCSGAVAQEKKEQLRRAIDFEAGGESDGDRRLYTSRQSNVFHRKPANMNGNRQGANMNMKTNNGKVLSWPNKEVIALIKNMGKGPAPTKPRPTANMKPTRKPTKRPTKRPTRKPTKKPTSIVMTSSPTNAQSMIPPTSTSGPAPTVASVSSAPSTLPAPTVSPAPTAPTTPPPTSSPSVSSSPSASLSPTVLLEPTVSVSLSPSASSSPPSAAST